MRSRGQSEPVEQVHEGGGLADASHHEVGAGQWGPLGVPCTHLGKDNEDVRRAGRPCMMGTTTVTLHSLS